MGTHILYIQGQVKGPKGTQADVWFILDSGVMYSVLPPAVWQTVGLKPRRKMTFTLADGTTIDRSISEAYVILPQGKVHTPVVLGEDGDQALLGVVTLEILGLVFNPFDRTLQPMRMLMC
jgi:predicted aspartyl protease